MGLNIYEKAPPLLKSLNRPEAHDQCSTPARNAEKEQPTKISDQDESFIYVQPLSDDEEEAKNEHVAHSSDEEEASRGDIRPTNFKVKGNRGRQPTHSTTDDDGFAPVRESASTAHSKQQDKSSPLRRSRRNGSESANSTPKKARLETSFVYKPNELEIFCISAAKSYKKPPIKYGRQSRPQGFQGSQSNPKPSPKAAFKKPPQGTSRITFLVKDSSTKLQAVDSEMQNSPDKKFKLPEQVVVEEPEMEAGKTFKTFDLPVDSPDLSPYQKPKFKLGPDLSELPTPEFDTSIFRTSDVMELLKTNGSKTKDLTDRVPFRAMKNGEDAQSQPRVFQMPSMLSDLAAGSQLEASETSCLEDISFQISPLSPEIEPEAACPMCGESVDGIFLRSYNGGKRMNISTQTKFCRAHKKKSARNEWAEKGYPVIDWSDLDTRLAQHHSYLKTLLDGASSYYRNILAEQVKSGKDRTLLQAVSNSRNSLTPGYYGSRGFRAMSENIMDKFSSQLRRIAVTDRLVAARGVTGYVQTVLVPELAVRLICEDMNLGVEEARQVMRESVDLGDLLNEEIEDVVTWKEGDETL